MLRLAVLASGNGSNFQAIADAVARQELHAEIAGVFCNAPGATVLERAAAANVPSHVAPSRGFTAPADRERYDAEAAERILAWGVDLVVLAGYMRLLTPVFVRRFPMKILNIHPSLLPAFPGLNVHEAVLAHGCKVSGCTVHFVDEGLDSGPILAQAAVPVLEDDTVEALAERVHKVEHQLYPWAIEQIALGRVGVEGRRVRITPPAVPEISL